MASMIEKSTGKPVDVPDDQVQAAFQSGQFGFTADQRIPIRTKEGNAVSVSANEAGKAFRGGASFIPGEEARQIQLDAKYGGVGGTIAAGAEGLARGATVGLFDPLAIEAARAFGGDKTAEKVRKHLDEEKEAHPWLSTGAEVAGALAPIALSGGAAAPEVGAVEGAELLGRGAVEAGTLAKTAGVAADAGRVLSAPARGVELAGQLTEKAIASLVGDASPSTVARIAQKALAKGGAGAVEGALYGAGGQISEDALGDHELAADKMMAAIGHGALIGNLLGAGSAVAVEGASALAKPILEKASPFLKRTASEQAFKSLSYGGLSPTRLIRAADRVGGAEGVGEELLRSKVVQALDKPETALPRIQQALDETGSKIDEIAQVAESKGVKIADIKEVHRAIMKDANEVLDGLKILNAPGYSKVEAALQEMDARFGQGVTPTLTQLRDFRTIIDQSINWARKENPAAQFSAPLEALTSVRRSLEKTVEDAIESQAKRVGLPADLIDAYKAEKLKYGRLSVARDIAEDSAQRAGKNATLSLTDKMLGAAEVAGSIASGHPLGALAGIGLSVGSKLVRERGNATAAVVLNKVAELSAAQKQIARFDTRVATDIDRFFDGKPSKEKAIRALSKTERQKTYDLAAARVKAANADLETPAKAAEAHLGDLQHAAPKLAAAFMQGVGRATVYLASQLPQERDRITFQPQLQKKMPPSDIEQEAFLRKVRALNDPATVVEDMTRGELTPDAVNAIKQVHPPLYQWMQQQVLERATDPEAKPMVYDQKIQLGVLFGVPTDDSLRPDFIQYMQAMYAQKAQQQGQPQVPKSRPGAIANIDTSSMKLSGYGSLHTK